jgi:hypothetical protein
MPALQPTLYRHSFFHIPALQQVEVLAYGRRNACRV